MHDPFGVLMCWVMTLKDHATGLIHICALPRKRPDLIAYKLQEIFGLIGYPRIFHTENGKEFTAKLILQFLWQLNPNILAVTGQPRRPQDQGSVENANATVRGYGEVYSLSTAWLEKTPIGRRCLGVLLQSSTCSLVEEEMIFLDLKRSLVRYMTIH